MNGFTLAEVLITLGIIGVVAAMTMPTLVARHQEKQKVVQLKKAYSVLSQAYQKMIFDYGTLDTWGIGYTDTGKVNEDGSKNLDRSGQYELKKRLSEYLNTVPYTGTQEGYTFDNQKFNFSYDLEPITIQTSDGTRYEIGYINPNNNSEIWIQLPNSKKRFGVTYFAFILDKQKIIPKGNTNSEFRYGCNLANLIGDKYNDGKYCTAWVLQNENMDYLHCNDLSFNGKHKCQ